MFEYFDHITPAEPEIYWDVALAGILAIVAEQATKHHPRLVSPRIRSMDVTNPFTLFLMQVTASMVAIGILHTVGLI
ncbi:hypothetical protein ACFZDB_13955 [Streptomyces luteogriseus]|uniref:hypothetical protein n=1 Tax=Streptomyces luteogriseus TaxID=68233 RepID=UPI0036E2101B